MQSVYNSIKKICGLGVATTVMVHNKWRCEKVQFVQKELSK